MPKPVLTHFKKHDPILYKAVLTCKNDVRGPYTERDLFASLCRTIVGQQLSGKAARAIWEKFKALFPSKRPTAAGILSFTDEQLRTAGLSYAKIRSLRDLSERVATKSLQLTKLRTAPEDWVRVQLQEVKGIGPWSSEMFLMFALGHEDIFSPGDLGLRKGMKRLYQLDTLPELDVIERISAPWTPYRTYAACVLWHTLDNQ